MFLRTGGVYWGGGTMHLVYVYASHQPLLCPPLVLCATIHLVYSPYDIIHGHHILCHTTGVVYDGCFRSHPDPFSNLSQESVVLAHAAPFYDNCKSYKSNENSENNQTEH